ncbi:MAG: STAS domain-containing protein [Pseudomonadota bacterium]
MQIEFEQRGKYMLLRAKGRLDAVWAEYFADTLLQQVREGRHHLIMDAAEMIFLSSAGIRSLLKVYKELRTVNGRFIIVNATDFVNKTLSTSGLQMLLAEALPKDMPAAGSTDDVDEGKGSGIQHFILNENSTLTFSEPAGWRPWQVVEKSRVQALPFSQDIYALGIASAADTFDHARNQFGEFLAVAGHVVYQPPNEQGPPDYLIAEKQFIPQMQCIQVLRCNGGMGRLIRFAATDKTPFFPVSTLLRNLLDQTGGKAAGFVMLGEIEGLVGTALIRSPGQIREEQEIVFPEIREWLTYCGERAYAHQQALLMGVVSPTSSPLLLPMPSVPDMATHIHGAVFPYQPLQNGKIELQGAIEKFFNGPPPLAVMHLADDIRPVIGLGETALLRGACWFSPLQNPEVL